METEQQYFELSSNNDYIIPDWPAPSWIKSVVTTRKRDKAVCCENAFDAFNIADHVNDDSKKVAANRIQLNRDLGLTKPLHWMQQVHGTQSVELLEHKNNNPENHLIIADASYTQQSNLPCVVMTADCLPVLLTNKTGTWISAIHAGWRGLCDGIIESTVKHYNGENSDLISWLGPAISKKHFEVGKEVKDEFVNKNAAYAKAFESHTKDKYMADLYFIARHKITSLEIETYGGEFCTYSDSEKFYSYRREKDTGRMASLIWIDNKA
ncbi:MAG: peptidoglycan editing factor PgeF [Kangiellaceae bacterium]